ncbi:hypothetical protein [Thalassomonas sp. M1454]|uniref:hypothetical protein n=1 Tax=Thalassomonas sp. M1454 TaxID=2594477 RepID=UPI00117E25EB|nr:hypothetical protein [Thalassomonas sp. M1454]TRX55711.1 hypothetical protein FNN08_08765 [Thalassomonas sp. M1454]
MYLAPDDKKRLVNILKGTSFSIPEIMMGVINIFQILMYAFSDLSIQHATLGLVVGLFIQISLHVNSRFSALLALLEPEGLSNIESKLKLSKE